MEQELAVGHVMTVGLGAVIADQLEYHTPVGLEGDFIHHPSLRKRALQVFLNRTQKE